MAREIRTTKMLLDERKRKLKQMDEKRVEMSGKLESSKKELNILSDSHTAVNDKITNTNKDIKELVREIGDLDSLALSLIDEIGNLFILKDKIFAEVKRSIDMAKFTLDDIHSKQEYSLREIRDYHGQAVDEQKDIQKQRRNLDIYKNRLIKKYKDTGKKVIL